MIDTLRDVVAKLDGLGVPYMVTGSYAMSVFGEIRMTRNIDIVVEITEADVTRLCRTFEDEYYISETSARRALDSKGMFNVISRRHGGKVDFIVKKDDEYAKQAFLRRSLAVVAGVKFWTSTIEDLMISKLRWASDSRSEMQIRDIANLKKSEYDARYVEAWVTELGLSYIWREVNQWTTQHRKPGT